MRERQSQSAQEIPPGCNRRRYFMMLLSSLRGSEATTQSRLSSGSPVWIASSLRSLAMTSGSERNRYARDGVYPFRGNCKRHARGRGADELSVMIVVRHHEWRAGHTDETPSTGSTGPTLRYDPFGMTASRRRSKWPPFL